MKRRALVLGLVPVASAGAMLAAACGGQDSSAPPQAGPPVQIQYWEQRTGADGERFSKAVVRFNDDQKKIVLQAQQIGGDYAAKLVGAAAAGQGPDVMVNNATIVTGYLGTSLLMDVDTPLKANKEWAQRKQQLSPTTLAGYQWQGKLVTIPADSSAIAVLYNREILKQAGLAEPSPTWTWDTFVDYCKKVKSSTGKWGCSFPIADTHVAIYWHNWAACNNAKVVDPVTGKSGMTAPEALEVSQFLDSVIRQQQTWVLAAITRDGRPPPDGTPFASGTAAFETQLPSTIQTWDSMKLNVGAVPMPTKKRSSSYAIPDHVIVFNSGNGPRQEATLQFGLWFTRPESQANYAIVTNRSPLYADVSKVTAYQQYLKSDPRVAVFDKAVLQGEAFAFFPKNVDVYNLMGKYMSQAVQGNLSIRDAHAQAERDMQPLLDQAFPKK